MSHVIFKNNSSNTKSVLLNLSLDCGQIKNIVYSAVYTILCLF